MAIPQSFKSTLRKQKRQFRRSLTPIQQRRASQKLASLVSRHPDFIRASTIAFYIASDGEISPDRLMALALRQGKTCVLPCISQGTKMVFRHKPRSPLGLSRNQFGIFEPSPKHTKVAPKDIDLVLLPLVAFDRQGSRLGMGGGYYDRAFAFKQGLAPSRPVLMGLAHQGQESAPIQNEQWDIAMEYIVSDKEVIAISRRRKI